MEHPIFHLKWEERKALYRKHAHTHARTYTCARSYVHKYRLRWGQKLNCEFLSTSNTYFTMNVWVRRRIRIRIRLSPDCVWSWDITLQYVGANVLYSRSNRSLKSVHLCFKNEITALTHLAVTKKTPKKMNDKCNQTKSCAFYEQSCIYDYI